MSHYSFGYQLTLLLFTNLPFHDHNAHLFLALSKGQILQLICTKSCPLSQFHEVSSWIRSRTEDEDNRWHRSALFKDGLKADDGWSHILFTHDLCHIFCDSTVDSIHSEASQKHQSFKVIQFCFILHWEWSRFRSIQVEPLGNGKKKTLVSLLICSLEFRMKIVDI